MGQHRAYKLMAALLFVVTICLAWAAAARALDDIRNFVFDSVSARRRRRPTIRRSPVRILAIDERASATSANGPGRARAWPRSSTKLGQLGAAAVAFDIIFAEPDRTSLENVVAAMPDGPLKADLHASASAPRTATTRCWRARVGVGPGGARGDAAEPRRRQADLARQGGLRRGG